MMHKPEQILERSRRLAGPVLFLFSLVLYSLSVSLSAFPGESARLIVQHTGIDPFPPMSHLLWNHMVRFVALFSDSYLVPALNWLSALFGAGAIWLMYEIASRIPHDRTSEEFEARVPMEPAKTLTGIIASLFLAFCGPFWFVSTRAHTASFDVFLLLLATYLLTRLYETRRPRIAYGFALLFGLGLAEFATFIVFAPIFALALAFCLGRASLLRFKPLLIVGLFFAAGLSLYFIYAWEYTLSPAYKWRKFTSYFMVLFYIFREPYRTIRFSLPQVGWLLVGLFTVLPWLIVILPKRSSTRSAMRSSIFLHGLLTILSVLVMFNLSISPWPLLGLSPLLVTPYVLLAICMGYLAGYWSIMIHRYSRFGSSATLVSRSQARALFFLLLAFSFITAAVLNYRTINRHETDALDRFVDEVVSRVDGRRWLVSSGFLDDLIELKARQRGKKSLIVLNTTQGKTESYLKYLSTLFDDPRLKGLIQVGLTPFLDEWLSGSPGIQTNVAVLASADIWLSSGFIPVPDRVLFLGATNLAMVDASRLFTDQKGFWNEYGKIQRKALERRSLVTDWNCWIQSHASKVANNTGILLEELGKRKEAFEAYAAARNIDTNNLSAMLNQLTLAKAESLPELPLLQKEMDAFENRIRGRLGIWSLSSRYGYVRNPDAFASRGWAWAMSGKPGVAIGEMQKALAVGANKRTIELAMASFYSMQRKQRDSEQMYLSVLKDNPRNPTALLGLAHIALRKSDYISAHGYLARLREGGTPESVVGVEETIVEAIEGNLPAAKAKLLKYAEDNPKNLGIWNILATIALEDKDDKLLDRCLAALTPAASSSQEILNTLNTVALTRGDFRAARKYSEAMLRLNPKNRQALECILQLDIRESNRTMAEDHIEQLLSIDPRNALGNMVLGSIQYAREEYELAEASYRTSLASQRSDSALNDLAWILQMKGNYDESLKLVQEAIALNKNNPSAWDTQGVVLMQLNRPDEAQQALQQALSFQPGNPTFILHIAQLYERKGMKEEALKLADPLLAHPAEMSPAVYEALRALIRKLRGPQT